MPVNTGLDMEALHRNYENRRAADRAGEAFYIIGRLNQMLSDFGLDELPFEDDRVSAYIATELIEIRDARQVQWLDALHEVRLQRADLYDTVSRRERSLSLGKLKATLAAALAEWRYELSELYLLNYEGELACETPLPTREFVWEVEADLPTAYLP